MKRSWWTSLVVLLLILGGIAGGLYSLLTYEPNFYTMAVQVDGLSVVLPNWCPAMLSRLKATVDAAPPPQPGAE